MKAIVSTAALVAAALGLIAAVVFGLGDSRTLVSPPEAVVESFVRALECGRYSQALKYLAASTRERTSITQLAGARARLEERIGAIEDVRGEAGWVSGDDAEAAAVLRTRRTDEARLPLRLRRENGEWRVMGTEGLAP